MSPETTKTSVSPGALVSNGKSFRMNIFHGMIFVVEFLLALDLVFWNDEKYLFTPMWGNLLPRFLMLGLDLLGTKGVVFIPKNGGSRSVPRFWLTSSSGISRCKKKGSGEISFRDCVVPKDKHHEKQHRTGVNGRSVDQLCIFKLMYDTSAAGAPNRSTAFRIPVCFESC